MKHHSAHSVTVYLPGAFDPYDSYGLIACQLLRHLDRLGVSVYAGGPGERFVENQPADVRRIINRFGATGPGGIMLGYPTNIHKFGVEAQYGSRVSVTMFESSRIPPTWPPILNTLDAVVVPSNFCKRAFIESGVTAPIHVIPLGVSETYQPALRPSGRKPYTFITWGDRGKRKGHFEAIQAFHRAFGDDPDYRLIVKARDIPVHAYCTNPNVQTVRKDMTEEELYALFLECDCMVFPTRGEGFGLPCREAAASGMTVIATNWSGAADDLEEWGIPLSYTLKEADWRGMRNLQDYDLGVWAIPDIDDLAYLMRVVADNRDEFRLTAVEKGRRVHELYSWERFARGVLDVWREVAGGLSQRQSPTGAPAYA